jgi:5-hydroxyisourate hydrolase
MSASGGGYVTTHVLDTALGRPAEGLRIEVRRIEGDAVRTLRTVVTNSDGRTDAPAIRKGELVPGVWELVFHAGAYLEATGGPAEGPRFLDVVPIRFGIADAGQHYHVPLLLSPFGYSTYRGS